MVQTRFEVHVTAECCANAKPRDPHWCLISLALYTSIRGATRPEVDREHIKFNFSGHRLVYQTPEGEAEKASTFDQTNVRPPPWSFVLDNPIAVTPTQNRGPKRTPKRAVTTTATPRKTRRWNGIIRRVK